MTAEMDATMAAALRAPFAPEQIGKLPRITCRDCRGRNANCSNHRKQQCQVCGGYLSTAHIHLDYVGHAAVTDRLLAVDPWWSWEPVAVDETFRRVVQTAFGQRRKMLRGALSGLLGSSGAAVAVLEAAGVDPQARGEVLGIADFARIAQARTTAGLG